MGRKSHLLLGQVVGEVGDHDLGLGRNAVSRGAALTALTGRAVVLASLVVAGLVGDVLQGLGGRGSGALGTLLLLLALGRNVSFCVHLTRNIQARTYTIATSTATTAATGATATAGGLTAASAFMALTGGTLGLLVRLGLASELDGDLALEDLLAGELSDGTLSLVGSREVDEGIADGAVGARVLGNGNRLTTRNEAG